MAGGLFQTVFIWFLMLPGLVFAQTDSQRLALVIGNSSYEAAAPLENPRNDASDLSEALERLEFDVTTLFDLTHRETAIALRDFARTAQGAEMAVIYYAGHGIEIDNRNYLIPVDAQLEQAIDVTYEAIELPMLLRAVRGAETLRLVLLDACRDNPFVRLMADGSTRSLNRGLVPVEPGGGVLVSFAAKGGTVALDGEGRNSPYAEALLEHIEEPGVEIGQLFRRVRDSVYRSTQGQQEPFTYVSLPASNIYLAPADPDTLDRDTLLTAFAQADLEGTEDSWMAFLEQYSDGTVDPRLIRRAEQRLAALRAPAAQPVPSVTAQVSPLIRACDKLAGDPDDGDLPETTAGVQLEDIDVQSARTACTLAVSGHPDHARSAYQLGRVMMSEGNGTRALTHYEEAAELGHVNAQVEMGRTYLEDAFQRQNRDIGIAALKAATEAGSPVAPRYLGDFFSRQRFITDTPQSDILVYYRLAAERGDLPAKFEAGYRLISSSFSTPEEVSLGERFLKEAATAGDEKSQFRLAHYYLSRKTEGDLASALEMLGMAAENGHVNALRQLIRMYSLGDRVATDHEAAGYWTLVGARVVGREFVVRAGYFHETGFGLQQSPSSAARFYLQALKQGSTLVLARENDDWNPQTARALQGLLRNSPEARYTGPIDGLIGRGTRAAMSRLCNCNALTQGVRFDQRLIYK